MRKKAIRVYNDNEYPTVIYELLFRIANALERIEKKLPTQEQEKAAIVEPVEVSTDSTGAALC